MLYYFQYLFSIKVCIMSTSCFDVNIKDSSLQLIIMSCIVFVDSGIYYKYGKNNLWYPKIFVASFCAFGTSFFICLFLINPIPAFAFSDAWNKDRIVSIKQKFSRRYRLTSLPLYLVWWGVCGPHFQIRSPSNSGLQGPPFQPLNTTVCRNSLM